MQRNCALVTGGSRGIGKAIALQLSKDHGLHILINYSEDTNAALDTLDCITSAGGTGEIVRFRVQEKTEVERALNQWQQNNPDKFISVLVNNAGVARDSLLLWMKENDWDDVISISMKGMFNVTQNVIRRMLIMKSGRIINIASLSGMKGIPGQTNYSAAKAGVIGATKALAQEVAKMKITVNAVAPGFINTGMLEKVEMDKYKKLIPMGRPGEPEEVSGLVSFLASEKASYITGEVINVNGGLYS